MPEPSYGPDLPGFAVVLENLDRQGMLYDTLLHISEQERDAICHADLTLLSNLLAEKSRIIAQAHQLEEERDHLCSQLALHWGSHQQPSLQELSEHTASPAIAMRLELVRITLSARVKKLQAVNSRNAKLIHQVRSINDGLIMAALKFHRHPMYDNRGDQTAQQPSASVIFDFRV